MRNVFLILIFSSAPALSVAQIDFRPGYVVHNNGDTVKGWVAYQTDKKSQQKCFFRTEARGESIIYLPGEIAGYGVYGSARSYESLKLPLNSPVQGYGFARTLATGNLHLYAYDNFYLVRDADGVMMLPKPQEMEIKGPDKTIVMRDQQYRALLDSRMDDCIDKSANFRFSEAEITDRVKIYNRCKNPNIVEPRQRPVIDVRYRLLTGYQYSKLKYDFVNKFTLTSHSITGGMGLEVFFPRKFDKVLFDLDVIYTNAEYKGSFDFVRVDPIRRHVTLDVTAVKIPFGFKYHLKGGRLQPYISAGVSWSGILAASSRAVEERKVQNKTVLSTFENEYPTKNPKGYWYSVGLKIGRSGGVFFELRQEGGEGYMGTRVNTDSKILNTLVLCGARF